MCIGSRTGLRNSMIPEIPGVICSFFILVIVFFSILVKFVNL